MLTLEVLNKRKYPTTSIIDSNLLVLYQRLKVIEAKWFERTGLYFTCNSGLRSQGQQNELVKAGKSNTLHSLHLLGSAADIEDESGAIKTWLKENPQILMVSDIWCEHWDYTLNWWHAQIVPPPSGRRWFIPYAGPPPVIRPKD